MPPLHRKSLRAVAPFGGVMSCVYMEISANCLFHKCMQATQWSSGLIASSWEIMLSLCMIGSHGFVHLWLMIRLHLRILWSYLMFLITSICLYPWRLTWNSPSSKLCCHWSTLMRKGKIFGNGHRNLESLSQGSTMCLASPILWSIPFLSGSGNVHAPSNSRFLAGFFWWIGWAPETWCSDNIGISKMTHV